jgi:single-strand DNA-binding protein
MYASITLIGHLGKDAEMSYSQKGVAYSKATLAVNIWMNGHSETNWYQLTFFGREAETINDFGKKGCKLFVQGTPQMQSYTTKSGEKVSTIQVVVKEYKLLDSKGSTPAAPIETVEYPEEAPF